MALISNQANAVFKNLLLGICTLFLATPVIADISRGAYLARAGDCVACHTAGPKALPFAGGVPLNSPFGKIYSANITPDPIYGIGRYTLNDFSRAVRDGIAKNGSRLYPAMPYPSFTRVTNEDIKALYDYFMTEVQPVALKPPETKLPFPFNIRWDLAFWDTVFVQNERFRPRDDRDQQWNRGAYLVQSLGHCGSCHTPRGLAFQEKAYTESSPMYLTGAVLDNWYAPNLTGNIASGLGRWSESDIVDYLATGHCKHGTASGSMVYVIENSTQYLNKDDLYAIAHYLKSLPPDGESVFYSPEHSYTARTLSAMAGEIERPGAGLYEAFCAKCHKRSGEGEPGKFPKLAGNSSVLSKSAISIIRLTLEGGKSATTRNGPKSQKMPGYAKKFSDQQIAEVLTFIRNSWGNQASAVLSRDVSVLRKSLSLNHASHFGTINLKDRPE